MTPHRSLDVLLADDEEIVCRTIGNYLRDAGHRVGEARNGSDALALIEAHDYDLALIDVRMPGVNGLTLLDRSLETRPELPVVIITGHGTMEVVIDVLRRGAADFLTKPIKLLELDAVIEKAAHIRRLSQDRRRLRETIRGIQTCDDLRAGNRTLVGVSPATREVRDQIMQVVDAQCDTILITGETGTGKEVVAREIHHRTDPGDAPFIAVCCPALPDSLAESELFGHVRGAFTGAVADRMGYFELANGGTLFLDDIADLPLSLQAKLLRVIETRMVRRVGGSKEVNVKARVIAATNIPLDELVRTGQFRQDLLYRLNVFTINLVPLRERRDDILPLATVFLSIYAASRNLRLDGFSPEAEHLLAGYEFPGNARELRNIVERAAILCRTGQVQAEHLRLSQCSPGAAPAKTGTFPDWERAVIVGALEEAKWNRRKAAADLGLSYGVLRSKLRNLKIP